MPRVSSHGTVFTFDDFQDARDAVVERSAETRLGFAVAARRVVTEDFGFLFPELQNNLENLLPEARATRDNLIKLGQTMQDTGDGVGRGDSNIPAAYTYFGSVSLESKSVAQACLRSWILICGRPTHQ